MSRIQILRESFKDVFGRYPQDNDELFGFHRWQESMVGGRRPTTAALVVAAPAVTAIVALIVRG